ncbi:FadR/GntR family transcriptional regulator [Actinocorallia aurantiaca]|jgi:DNA-binding FadR family transcriptional regulator|uniref:FadR/GntR family transcriptional regulator n=1 Tax=Actinocorallia aurantiaca TaxID=46204 RepID=A0ABP6GC14_9ACTN
MTLSAARRTPLFEQVVGQLREQITSGRWPVGSRIPIEPELAEQLGVARGTVREAVRALAHNGLLDIRQGSGTYVSATSELAGVMRRRFAGIGHADIRELRMTLEASAAALAAARRTEADLALLQEALDQRDRAWDEGDTERFVQTDAAFHHAVVAASHNAALTGLYADLGEVLRDELRDHFTEGLYSARKVDHDGLVEAIRAGDVAAATREAVHFFPESSGGREEG